MSFTLWSYVPESVIQELAPKEISKLNEYISTNELPKNDCLSWCGDRDFDLTFNWDSELDIEVAKPKLRKLYKELKEAVKKKGYLLWIDFGIWSDEQLEFYGNNFMYILKEKQTPNKGKR